METTNEGMSKQVKISKFMESAFEIAVEFGESEMTVKTFDGKIWANIETKKEIYLKKVQDIAGDIQVTISMCFYGLCIHLWQEL